MSNTQLSIIPFLSKSKDDFALMSSVTDIERSKKLQNEKKSFAVLKRPLGALHYRTRSFHPFKLPRKLKKGTLLKRRIVDQKLSSISRFCRKQRRRLYFQSHLLFARYADSAKPNRLPTHIWHRKRFIMKNRNGIVTAMRSSCRGFKAIDTQRKKNKCFFHDQSYLRTIELICTKEELLLIFKHTMVMFTFSFQYCM